MESLHTQRTTAVLLGALVTAATVACGGAARNEPRAATRPIAARATETATAATTELEALYRARTDSARMRFTEADVRFMTGMIAHHAQALVMAGLAPTHGASPRLRTLTARIINAQRDEIAWMQTWLRDRGRPVPQVHIEGTELTVSGVDEDLMHMPGMLTPQQMRDLDRSRETEFDRRFLTYMIQHHQGAVSMVDELFGTDGAAQGGSTFKLASDIQVDQATEIARMKLMLEALPGSGGGP
ncbi:MAG: DUF305 domain-containing protein [Gemmatimonadota bacterium]